MIAPYRVVSIGGKLPVRVAGLGGLRLGVAGLLESSEEFPSGRDGRRRLRGGRGRQAGGWSQNRTDDRRSRPRDHGALRYSLARDAAGFDRGNAAIGRHLPLFQPTRMKKVAQVGHRRGAATGECQRQAGTATNFFDYPWHRHRV